MNFIVGRRSRFEPTGSPGYLSTPPAARGISCAERLPFCISPGGPCWPRTFRLWLLKSLEMMEKC